MSDEPARCIHIVWAMTSDGPVFIVAYRGSRMAHQHRLTMLGVEVSACEFRDDLPEHVKEDIYIEETADFDEETPVDVVGVGDDEEIR